MLTIREPIGAVEVKVLTSQTRSSSQSVIRDPGMHDGPLRKSTWEAKNTLNFRLWFRRSRIKPWHHTLFRQETLLTL